MEVSPAMSDAQSRKDASSPARERSAGSATTAGASAPQIQEQNVQSHLSDDGYVVVDAFSPGNGRRRSKRHQSALGAAHQAKEGERAEVLKETGHKQMQIGGLQAVEGDNKAVEKDSGEEKTGVQEQTSDEEQTSGERATEQKLDVDIEDVVEVSSKGEETAPAPARVPSPAVHISGVDMVFPEDEVPIELCPFSSDGSADDLPLEQSTARRSNDTEDAPSEAVKAAPSTPTAPTTPTAESAAPEDTAPTTPASVTAEESVTQSEVGRTMGRRKRRKKLSYSASRRREAAKTDKGQNSVPSSPALEDKISIAVNGHAAQNGGDIDASAPPSPVYPDADASHLYPSTPEGAPWQWEDVDPYFDPLAQSDLDNLVRWRKDNANFIASNPTAWRGKSGVETKRAVLEAMVADASDGTTGHVECPIRRGRSYRDVWEEKDFLAQQKRDSSAGESHLKSQATTMKKKRKGVVDAKGSLLVSHQDLVYGYDDDLFQDFRGRLEDRVKACQSRSPPTTPLTPPRRQQATTTKVDESTMDISAQEIVFEEEVLPSFPISQLHPASLGLWKLRKNQEPDFDVVHPASVNRVQVPARWKEEMARHHQQQYELQLQQADELADPSDGDDEGTGDNTHKRPQATVSNSEITGGLPSFGDCTEEDEISQVLAASVSKLIPLSMLNWRTTQLVYERAACSIQCAPILEGEAAAARELEDVYLQLCPPGDASEESAAPPGTAPARRPRTTQINSIPHDMIAYSVRRDIADNCSLAVAASVEFALGLHVGDVVDVLDRNGCWNYGEVVETYSENTSEVAKFVLLRFSLWSEDTVEWISASEGRLLPRGVADGSSPCSVGPTRAHRVRVRYDQSLARELERSFPQRQAKQATAASQMLAYRQQTGAIRPSSEQQKTPQKRKRKRPAKSTALPSPN